MPSFTVALLQMTACGNDIAANQTKGDAFCRRARAMGADLALFPEMWSVGYTPAAEWDRQLELWREPSLWPPADPAAAPPSATDSGEASPSGRMIRFFKEEGVEKAIMAGQVKHVQIFSRAVPDARMLKVLLKLPRRNTDALIGAIASELQSEGIELVDSTCFLQDSLPQSGTLTRREPSKQEREDIEYGLEIAREIARLDLGQTIVVRGRACVAIEAMEGTDETISRAGKLAKGRLTVVKVAKPDQDMRFDVPVVGVPTIETMIEAGATCLSITAGKTLMFDRDEMIRVADKNKISIVAAN